MANVPGVLIVGDYSVQGGNPGMTSAVSALGAADLNFSRADRVMRVFPDNPTTGAPTSTSLNWKPWFDGGAGDSLFAVTTSASNTVTVTPSPSWTTNQWAGFTVTVVNPLGLGFSDRKTVVSNTADTLTISGSWTSNPVSPQFLFLSQGRWRDYHAIAGWLAAAELGVAVSTRGGSSWQAGGLGIGLDAGLLRELYENVWKTSPYFQLAKYALITPTGSAFDNTTGSAKTAFTNELARYNAAWTALANGNTLAWELLVLDLSNADVLNWVSTPANYLNYETALTQTIAWFRSAPVLNNASLKVVIVNHANEVNNVTAPSGTALANRAHRAVAAAGTNIRCASMEGLPLYLPSPFLPSANKGYYEAQVYWNEMPRRVRQAYELLTVGNPTDYDGAMPVYLMFGDSIFVGEVNETFTTQLKSPTLTGGPRDSRQRIYNRGTATVETYDLADNSNTSGTTGNFGGPDFSLVHELMQLHPVTGFVLVKRASNASTLVVNGAPYSGGGTSGGRWSKTYQATEHFGELKNDFEGALSYINNTLGRQADLKGIFVSLGTNDQAYAGGGALFAAELATFVADLRSTFATRTSGDPVPVIWRRPQLTVQTAVYAEAVRVRAALADYAAVDAQFEVVNVDDLERLSTDNIHETPESAIIDGQRLVAALQTVAI